MMTRTTSSLPLFFAVAALHACGAPDPSAPAGKVTPPDLDLDRAEATPATVGYARVGDAQSGMVTLSRERGVPAPGYLRPEVTLYRFRAVQLIEREPFGAVDVVGDP